MLTFQKFKSKEKIKIIKAKDNYLYTKQHKILDFTSGWTGYASLGHNNNEILKEVFKQSKKFCHLDYNEFDNQLIEQFAKKFNSFSKIKFKVWCSGNSGSESVEAAMKLSYQVHYANNNKKKIKFIHRSQSFHGATLHPLLVSNIDVLDIYSKFKNNNFIEIPQHNIFAECKSNRHGQCNCGKKNVMHCMGIRNYESTNDYLSRSIYELEKTILDHGPENICAFIGETQLGSLVGDVPPIKKYWQKVSGVCKKYNIHLILDEIYCGIGRSGKFFNFEWDNCYPDFVCVGKNTTSGIIPISYVMAKEEHEKKIINKLGRVALGHTFQGHSLGISASIKLIEIIKRDRLLKKINKLGKKLREIIHSELKNHPNYKNTRGRGFAFSCEHKFKQNHKFGLDLKEKILNENKILVNSKWHRTSFLPSYTISEKEALRVIDVFLKTFKYLAKKNKYHK